jgi:hypothetical protein
MVLAASLAALVIGFGAGYWQAAPSGDIRLAGVPADGTESGQYEAALYQALQGGSPGTRVSYMNTPDGRRGAVTIVGSVAAGVGGDCLEFRREWNDAGSKVESRGLACRSDRRRVCINGLDHLARSRVERGPRYSKASIHCWRGMLRALDELMQSAALPPLRATVFSGRLTPGANRL